MKYIAYEGTWLEQVWDSKTKEIKFTGCDVAVKNCKIQKQSETWRKLK